jgi:hypothetical protein
MVQAKPEPVVQATGKSWDEWFAVLDAAGARAMTHKEIARWLYDQSLIPDGRWCQGVTVAYERQIGRREVGQTCDGDFRTSTSTTLTGTLDGALAVWQERVGELPTFDGVAMAAEPKVSKTDKWRYWRAKLVDGSAVEVRIYVKPDGLVSLGLEHGKLPDKPTADAWKAFWKPFLASLCIR